MRNFVQPGDVLTLIAPAAVKSGGVVSVGAFVGVATSDAAQGAAVETQLVGVFELPKGQGALAQGQIVFWDGSRIVGESGGDEDDPGLPVLGAVTQAAGADASTCLVRLNGVVA